MTMNSTSHLDNVLWGEDCWINMQKSEFCKAHFSAKNGED